MQKTRAPHLQFLGYVLADLTMTCRSRKTRESRGRGRKIQPILTASLVYYRLKFPEALDAIVKHSLGGIEQDRKALSLTMPVSSCQRIPAYCPPLLADCGNRQ